MSGVSWLPSLTTNALAFGAASFASSVLCTLFFLYNTPVFTSVYQVSFKLSSGHRQAGVHRLHPVGLFLRLLVASQHAVLGTVG